MASNTLHITQAGLLACANAKAGGFLINVRAFALGSGNTPFNAADTALAGNVLHTGAVSIVEVISPGVAKFTLDVPQTLTTFNIVEIGLYLDSGVLFARGLFAHPTTKDAALALRIFAIVAATNCDLTALDVTVGDIFSIPSVASVSTLPAPNTSNFNTIAVLDLKHNFDNTSSGSLVVKYGDGGLDWSFMGYSRLYFGFPDHQLGAVLTTSEFAVQSLNSEYTLINNELFIVQVISGAGQGESRRVTYSTSTERFTEIDSTPFTSFDATSKIALWRGVEAGNIFTPASDACAWPPTLTGVPSNWVLSRGATCPTWISPSTLFGPNSNPGVYVQPCDLTPYYTYFTGDGLKTVFDTGLNLASNNTFVCVDGVTQHHDTYDVLGTVVQFSEAPPSGTMVEIAYYKEEFSTGSILHFKTYTVNPDGITTRFNLNFDNSEGYPIADHYAICHITGFKQSLYAYSLDQQVDGSLNIVFNEAPAPGLSVQVVVFTKVPRLNYCTTVTRNLFYGTGAQDMYELSEFPEDINYTFVYLSGVLLHNNKYTLSGNKLIIADTIKKDLPILVVIFKNRLSEGQVSKAMSGVVTGAHLSEKYLRLERYDAPDYLIPMPKINLYGGKGIDVSGNFPNYTITNITDQSRKRFTVKRFNTSYSKDDLEEIVYTYKFVYDYDCIVTVTTDFCTVLGPGFKSLAGGEYVEYVLGIKTPNTPEPPYGRRVKGTGQAGFTYLDGGEKAFSNSSITQSFEFNLNNLKSDTVTFVAKLRIRSGAVSQYKSALDLNFSLVCIPKIVEITQ